jgi:hypothetical protein
MSSPCRLSGLSQDEAVAMSAAFWHTSAAWVLRSRYTEDRLAVARARLNQRRGVCPRKMDASLYQWPREAGLTLLICFPQLIAVAPDDPRVPMLQQALAALSGEEATESLQPVAAVEVAGASFIPHHCAVATRP